MNTSLPLASDLMPLDATHAESIAKRFCVPTVEAVGVSWSGYKYVFPLNRLKLRALEYWCGRDGHTGWALYVDRGATSHPVTGPALARLREFCGSPWLQERVFPLGGDPIRAFAPFAQLLAHHIIQPNPAYPPLRVGREPAWTSFLAGTAGRASLVEMLAVAFAGDVETDNLEVVAEQTFNGACLDAHRPDLVVRLTNGRIIVIEAQSGAGVLDEDHFRRAVETYPWHVADEYEAKPSDIRVIVVCGSTHESFVERASLPRAWSVRIVVATRDDDGVDSFMRAEPAPS